MGKPAAISATFADWRTVKSRKQLQLVFEVPLERQAEVLAMLGAPMPDRETWVAIALLKQEPEQRVSEPKSEGQRAVQRAGILSNDAQFQEWVASHQHFVVACAEDAARYIRGRCGIVTRRDIAVDPRALEAFKTLELEYQMATGRHAVDVRA